VIVIQEDEPIIMRGWKVVGTRPIGHFMAQERRPTFGRTREYKDGIVIKESMAKAFNDELDKIAADYINPTIARSNPTVAAHQNAIPTKINPKPKNLTPTPAPAPSKITPPKPRRAFFGKPALMGSAAIGGAMLLGSHLLKSASAFIDEISKIARKMPHFTDQNRDPKAKEVYRSLKREHPGWPAGKKARIAEAAANEAGMGAGDQPGGIRYSRKK